MFARCRESLSRDLLHNLLPLTTMATPQTSLPAALVFMKTSLIRNASNTPCLHVQIYTGKPATSGKSLISPHDSIPGPTAANGRYSSVERPKHPLNDLLNYMLRDNFALKRMNNLLKPLAWTPTLTTLLTTIEAQANLPEAPQPAGLSKEITLHDYQRCGPWLHISQVPPSNLWGDPNNLWFGLVAGVESQQAGWCPEVYTCAAQPGANGDAPHLPASLRAGRQNEILPCAFCPGIRDGECAYAALAECLSCRVRSAVQ